MHKPKCVKILSLISAALILCYIVVALIFVFNHQIAYNINNFIGEFEINLLNDNQFQTSEYIQRMHIFRILLILPMGMLACYTAFTKHITILRGILTAALTGILYFLCITVSQLCTEKLTDAANQIDGYFTQITLAVTSSAISSLNPLLQIAWTLLGCAAAIEIYAVKIQTDEKR